MTNPARTNTPAEGSGGKSVRLHYLDWLQVLAVLGVILFHTIVPFDALVPWGIKNAEQSTLATLFSVFFAPWGMPFFFLMVGVTSWFSLLRRTPDRNVCERVTQLLIPFIVGTIVLTPISFSNHSSLDTRAGRIFSTCWHFSSRGTSSSPTSGS